MLCERTGATLKVIPMNDKGELIMLEYDKLLSQKTKIVAVNHISNVLGISVYPWQKLFPIIVSLMVTHSVMFFSRFYIKQRELSEQEVAVQFWCRFCIFLVVALGGSFALILTPLGKPSRLSPRWSKPKRRTRPMRERPTLAPRFWRKLAAPPKPAPPPTGRWRLSRTSPPPRSYYRACAEAEWKRAKP